MTECTRKLLAKYQINLNLPTPFQPGPQRLPLLQRNHDQRFVNVEMVALHNCYLYLVGPRCLHPTLDKYSISGINTTLIGVRSDVESL